MPTNVLHAFATTTVRIAETVKFLVCDAVRHIKNKSYTAVTDPVTLNTTGRETPYFLLTSGLEHGPWRHAAANK